MAAQEFDLLHAARTEDLDDSQIIDLIVLGHSENEVVTKLKFQGSHLLQGARGIGKSMLLKEAERQLDSDFNQDKNLGVYVNFKTSTLLEGVKADNKNAFQIWVGAKILEALYSKLIKLGVISKDSSSDPFKRVFNISTTVGMRNALKEKIHLLQKLSKKEGQDEVEAEIGDEFLEKLFDISYLSDLIKEVVQEYNLSRVVFFFDEAAHTFIPKQQEIFFEILKMIQGGKVAVKAAVYPTITAYGKNFEIGQDAILITLGKFESGSAGREASRSLYRQLIKKRLPPDGPLQKRIFEKGALLDQCIHLASGNPRAFLHLFNRVYEGGYTNRALIKATKEYVDEELLPYHLGLAKRLPKYSHHVKIGLQVLQEFIVPEIRKKNNRSKKTQYQSAFFTLPRDVPPNLKMALDLMCYSGVLSKQGQVKIAGKKTGQRYMVHLALLFTEKAFSSENFGDIISKLSLTDYREFSGSDPSFTSYLGALKNSSEKCQNCSTAIPPNAKFCLECGNKVEERSIVGDLLDDDVDNLSISERIATRLKIEFPSVGDVVHAEREEIMELKYIKEVRSKRIKNAADEYISG